MKPENILKTDWLDILFQNKNKDYGAYQLRKQYSNRLKKSLGITALLVLVFAGLQSWKTPKKTVTLEFGKLATLELQNLNIDKPKPREIEKEKPAPKNDINEVKNTTVVIVPKDKADSNIRTNNQLDTSKTGFQNIFGNGRDSGLVDVIHGDTGDGGNGKGKPNKDPETGEGGIELNPSVMPEFVGGIDALRNFMLRNLRQPDDIEEGQKIMVIARFVVDKNGQISDVEIEQSGREDLDDEVRRVIKRMPAWKPGLQNGFPVAAYFKMPVTFINNN